MTELSVEVDQSIYDGLHALVASGKYLSVSDALTAHVLRTEVVPTTR